MRFEGTPTYVATEDLKVAVNAAVKLRRPLLVKGEPGTGKTVLAQEIAAAIGAPLIEWHIKSTTRAVQGLYEYDAVARLRDGQLGDERVHDIANYIKRGKLWDAFTSPELPVLLIDEIDKADIEFPNDLLQELDRMEFHVYETGETVRAVERPVVVIDRHQEPGGLEGEVLGGESELKQRCREFIVPLPGERIGEVAGELARVLDAYSPDHLRRVRDELVYNFGRASEVLATQIEQLFGPVSHHLRRVDALAGP